VASFVSKTRRVGRSSWLIQDAGALRRFTFRRSILDWLRRRPPLYGWAIACPWCEWGIAQADTKAGLWLAYRAHRDEAHP
jgi:hypothetical protein